MLIEASAVSLAAGTNMLIHMPWVRRWVPPEAWAGVWPFLVIGGTCVVAGGLVAAATAPAPSEHGSWAAAYLVLVCGAASVALAVGQAAITRTPSRLMIGAECMAWNTGNAAVLAGVLADLSWLVAAGSVALVSSLALFFWVSRTRQTQGSARLLLGYRSVLGLLLASVLAGTVLAQL